MRMVLFIILLILTIWSCGSRKVVRDYSSEKLGVNSVVESNVKVSELKESSSFYEKVIGSTSFKADRVVICPDGSVEIINPEINSASENNIEASIGLDKNIRDDYLALSDEFSQDIEHDSSAVDKRQFSWWSLAIPALIIGALLYVLKRFRIRELL